MTPTTMRAKLELTLKMMQDRKHDIAGLGAPIFAIKDVIQDLSNTPEIQDKKDIYDEVKRLNGIIIEMWFAGKPYGSHTVKDPKKIEERWQEFSKICNLDKHKQWQTL